MSTKSRLPGDVPDELPRELVELGKRIAVLPANLQRDLEPNYNQVVDYGSGIYRQIIHADAAEHATGVKHGLPLQKTSRWRRHSAVLQRLPVSPPAHWLLYVP